MIVNQHPAVLLRQDTLRSLRRLFPITLPDKDFLESIAKHTGLLAKIRRVNKLVLALIRPQFIAIRKFKPRTQSYNTLKLDRL